MSKEKSSANMKNQDLEDVIIEEKITNARGETKIKKYKRGKYLGKGGFAKCYVCTNQETKKIYAAKIISKKTLTKSRQRAKLLSEIRIHRSLKHQNVVRFEHVFEDSQNVYILLELCKNNNVNNYIKRKRRINEMMAKSFTIQIVNALKYLHMNKIIHRDLKLGNLFLSEEGEIKLGDFGLAAKLEFETEKRYTLCGTPNYIAPEILVNKEGHSFGVDIWSLGVIIYTLVIGKPPFETENVKETYRRIKQCSYKFPDHIKASDEVKDLISKILVKNPTKRLTLDEIMKHPFLGEGEGVPLKIPPSWLKNPNSAQEIEKYCNLGKKKESNTQSTRNMMMTDVGSTIKSRHQSTTKFEGKDDGAAGGANAKNGEVYVVKWVDYSSKYGLGYLLSNGSSGVFFNDCTKIVLSPNKEIFQYIERRSSDRTDIVSWYSLKNYPDLPQMGKKVTLLQHFRSYLEGVKAESYKPTKNAPPIPIKSKSEHLPYLKKWMKTRHAIMFRLSNKLVQVDFQDKTQIKLSSETKMVTYLNKKGQVSKINIALAFEENNTEMQKRLKYTKEILTHMLSSGNRRNNR